MNDFGVRKYDEDIGRFTSIDPMWEDDYDLTPYHYCGNNPVSKSDPSGYQEIMFGWEFTVESFTRPIADYIKPMIEVGKDVASTVIETATKAVVDVGPKAVTKPVIAVDKAPENTQTVDMSRGKKNYDPKKAAQLKEERKNADFNEHRQKTKGKLNKHQKGESRKEQPYTDKKRFKNNFKKANT